MKEVFTTTSLPEAHAACARLRGNGIECVLENEGGAFCAVGMPTSAVPFAVSVGDADEAHARDVLQGRETEDPADVPAPAADLSQEEEARFKERIRKGSEAARSRWKLVAALFIAPTILVTAGYAVEGEWNVAGVGLIVLFALIGPALLLHFLAKPPRGKDSA